MTVNGGEANTEPTSRCLNEQKFQSILNSLGELSKIMIPTLHLDQLNQNLWEWDSSMHIFLKFPEISILDSDYELWISIRKQRSVI